MVVSHERSGTHFLINSIAKAYGYSPLQLDLDDTLQMNVFAAGNIAAWTGQVARATPGRPIKSHHSVEFFTGVLDRILAHTTIFYIYRHPADVMISYWRLIHKWVWREGPRVADALAFAASEPEGRMMRYQMRQTRNLLERWARHVEGWTAAAAIRPRLVTVAYEDLDTRYEATVKGLSPLFGRPPVSLERPSRDAFIVPGVPAETLPEPDRAAICALALSEVGDTMRALGYR